MSNSREDSPDWLRSFQPPTQSAIELSSGSESPLDHSPVSDDEDDINLSKLFKKEAPQVSDIKDNDDKIVSVVKKAVKGKSPKKNEKVKTPERKRKNEEGNEKDGKKAKRKDTQRKNTLENDGKSSEHNHSILSLSSDSESSPDASPVKKNKAIKKEIPASNKDLVAENSKNMVDILSDHDDKSPTNQVPKVEYPIKEVEEEDDNTLKKKNKNRSINGENDTNNNAVKKDVSGKHLGPQVSSSRVPLLLSDKVQRSKALVECDGDSIDLSGDVGSVGRVVVSDDPAKNHEMLLDLKGRNHIQNNHSSIKDLLRGIPSIMTVSFGQSEAKIEAIMNDYIQLKPLSNVYEAETMVEGTLDGFSFDSEDEADKGTAQADQQEAAEEQPDGKTKRKADKTSGVARKKGKPAGGKPAKNVKKKPQVTKKGKTKK